jgi:hypothetical protein
MRFKHTIVSNLEGTVQCRQIIETEAAPFCGRAFFLLSRRLTPRFDDIKAIRIGYHHKIMVVGDTNASFTEVVHHR